MSIFSLTYKNKNEPVLGWEVRGKDCHGLKVYMTRYLFMKCKGGASRRKAGTRHGGMFS